MTLVRLVNSSLVESIPEKTNVSPSRQEGVRVSRLKFGLLFWGRRLGMEDGVAMVMVRGEGSFEL